MKPLFHSRLELKAKRLSEELTSGRLSCMTGVSRTSIERFENGTRDFSSNSFVKVLYALGFCIISKDEYAELIANSTDKCVKEVRDNKLNNQKRPKLNESI